MQTQLQPIRAHPRVPAGFVVRIIHNGRVGVAVARDLSMVGVSLDAALPLGAEVTLALCLPGEASTLLAGARVERSDDHGAALTFTDLSWPNLFALARFLSPRL